MKGIQLYLILFAVLAAVAVYFFLGRRPGTYTPAKGEFAVVDTGRIEWVNISTSEEEVNFLRTGYGWQVNGNPAKKESILGLYVLLTRIEVEAPVSRSLEDRIQGGLEHLSTRVRVGIADGREKAYRVYYDNQSSSTFMRMEGSDVAFRVRIRGYRQTNLAELFHSDQMFWRDNVIFHYLPGNIRGVSLRNNINPDRSFHLARNEMGEFHVASGIVPGSWEPAARKNVTQYLGYFSDVRFEAFLDPGQDTLQHASQPDRILTLDLLDGERIILELFQAYRISDNGTKFLDLDNIYARIGKGDEWIVVKYIQIDPLLKEFEYFTDF